LYVDGVDGGGQIDTRVLVVVVMMVMVVVMVMVK
jgi:hypothetical protein